MKPDTIIVGIIIILTFITCILFVLFGQITVRKLRKNPETKNHLGVQFVHGWINRRSIGDGINRGQTRSIGDRPRLIKRSIAHAFNLSAEKESLSLIQEK